MADYVAKNIHNIKKALAILTMDSTRAYMYFIFKLIIM